jgi:adenylylsulfate kinase
MKKKILIMGLSGSGKTTLSKKLITLIDAVWLNADKVRSEANDWDFSEEGRKRQANRMKKLSEKIIKNDQHVIADFICPTEKTRENFNADYLIFMDTIKACSHEDTNKMFVKPKKYDYRVTKKNAEAEALKILNLLKDLDKN